MTKNEFLNRLRARLSDLPKNEVEERLGFYSEMIDDRVEEGLTEEAAVTELGSVETVARQIISEIPIMKIVKDKMKPKRRFRAWEIVLLAVGSPVWLSLLIAAFAVLLSLYIVLWAVAVVTAWAVFGALVGCSFGGVVAGAWFVLCGYGPTGLALIGAAIFLGGLSIFTFYGCLAATKGTVLLTRKIALGIKYCFVGKERENG